MPVRSSNTPVSGGGGDSEGVVHHPLVARKKDPKNGVGELVISFFFFRCYAAIALAVGGGDATPYKIATPSEHRTHIRTNRRAIVKEGLT